VIDLESSPSGSDDSKSETSRVNKKEYRREMAAHNSARHEEMMVTMDKQHEASEQKALDVATKNTDKSTASQDRLTDAFVAFMQKN
jgi:DNA-binding LacI/PurR family transcriptional regulator